MPELVDGNPPTLELYPVESYHVYRGTLLSTRFANDGFFTPPSCLNEDVAGTGLYDGERPSFLDDNVFFYLVTAVGLKIEVIDEIEFELDFEGDLGPDSAGVERTVNGVCP